MKNLLLPVFLFLLIPEFSISQNFVWAEKLGGPSSDQVIDIDIDSANNSVIVGLFYNSTTFGTTTLFPSGTSDGFVAKIDQDGNPLWAIAIGSSSSDEISGVAIDKTTGDIYVTGTYNASFTLAGTFLPYAQYGSEVFLAKISSTGSVLWARGFSGIGSDYATDVTVDESNGFVYTVGVGSQSLDIDTTTLSVSTGQFVYLSKFTTSGSFKWAKQFNTDASLASSFSNKQGGICMLSNNEVAITGNFRNVINFGSIGLGVLGSFIYTYDGYVARIDTSGTPVWAKGFGSSLTDYSNDIAADQFDNIWLTGTTAGPSSFGSISLSGSGSSNVFIAKYSSTGTASYAHQSVGSSNFSNGIAVDTSGYVYFTGGHFNPITFGSFALTNPSFGTKLFVVKLNSNTNTFEWAIGANYSQSFSPAEEGKAIAVSDIGEIFLTGTFSGSINLGNSTLLTSGSNDVFITKMGDCSTLSAEITAASSTSICTGNSVLLEADTASEYNYQWLYNGANVPGQVSNSFSASQSGNYAVIIDSIGCIDTSSVITVTVNAAPSVSHTNLGSYCNDAAPFVLTGGTPAGGVYSGSAVTLGSTFNPSMANLGTNLVTYTYTDANSCSDSVTKTIVINQTPAIFINAISACENGSPISIAGPGYGFPQGGIHSGPGVVGTTFNPSIAGVGTHVIYYASGAGCVADDSIVATVTAAPTVSITPISNQCISTGFLPLASYGSPFGGTFSGSGISSNFFYPGIAGAGTHQIVYSYSANGCTGYDTFQLVVDPFPNISFSLIPAICEGSAAVSLPSYAYPSGGVFSGIGVSNDSIFNPITSGVGTFNIVYSITNACGTDVDSTTVTVSSNPVASISTVDVSCNGFNDGSALATSATGTLPFSYAWSNASTSASITSLAAGNYTVSIIDANGCSDSAVAMISEPSVISLSFTSSDASCNGGSNGTASVTALGGTPGYSYSWSNAATTSTINGLAFGSYSVTVTDGAGCNVSGSVSIGQPNSLLTSLTTANVLCNGGANGSVTASVSGGTPAYSYSWSNGSNTASLSGLSAGNYTLTVSDQNGCIDITTASITESTPLIATIGSVTNVSCSGNNDGSASASASGGTAPYSFLWSNSATSTSVSNLSVGSYTVTVTDANGCQTSQTVAISQPASLLVNLSPTSVSCNGGIDGAAMSNVTGGTAPYSYLWSNAATSATASNLSAGTYTLTVTDVNGCSQSSSVLITQPTLLNISLSSTNVSCNAGNDGSASATASGGSLGYTYAWSDGQTSNPAAGLSAGTYTVTVTDANGCSQFSSVLISEPSALSSTSTVSDVSCNGGNNGSISVSLSGGTSPYSYLWSNGSVNASISGLAAGNYSYTATDLNGCQLTETVNVAQPALPVTVSVVSVSDVSCFSGNDGSISVSGLGGVPSYTYLWSNGSSTANVAGLSSGTYTVTVSDANGCSGAQSIFIGQPTSPVLASIVSSTNAICVGSNNGDALVSGSGGTPGYTYAWSNSASTPLISGLVIGTYTVTVTDINGCVDTAQIDIIPAITAAVATISSSTDASCLASNDGSATVSVVGGTLPYTYSWSNSSTSSTISGLVVGTYTVTVNSSNGCTDTTSVVIANGDNQAPIIQATDTTIFLNAAGSFLIDPSFVDLGTTDNCQLDSVWLSRYAFDCTDLITPQSLVFYAVDESGNVDSVTRFITVIDTIAPIVVANNIMVYLDASGLASVSASAIDGGSFDACGIDSIFLSQDQFDCNDLGVSSESFFAVDASGNVGAANFTVSVFDTISPTIITNNAIVYLDQTGIASLNASTVNNGTFDNCTLDNVWLSQENFNCSEVGSNIVTFYAVDNSGNLDSAQLNVTVLDANTPSIVVNNAVVYLDAFGSASINVDSVNAGTFDNCALDSVWISQENFDCSEVGSNIVTFYAVDISGNLDSTQLNVTVLDTNTPTIVVNNAVVYLDAFGSASINVDSVNAGTFDNCDLDSVWINQENFDCSETGSNSVTFYALDISGNLDSLQFTVTVIDTNAPIINVVNAVVYINAAGIASIDVDSVNAGTLDNCSLDSIWLSQENFDCSDIGANLVTFYASDIFGNIDSAQISITVIDTIAPTVNPMQLVLVGLDANGNALISANEADSATADCDLDSLWLSQSAFTCNDIGLNLVYLFASDGSGNVDSALVSVVVFDTLSQLEIVVDNSTICNGDSSGALTALASGMNGIYSYNWNTGASTAQITNLAAGTYFVLATSEAGCEISDSITLTQQEPFNVFLFASQDSLCAGDSSAYIATEVDGFSAPYSYLWNNGSTNDTLSAAGAGSYVVTVTDSAGCEAVESLSIALIDCDTSTNAVKESIPVTNFSIFPNPASNVLNVNFGSWIVSEDLKLTLMNSTGQFIKSFDRNQLNQVNPNEVQLNLEDAAAGIYLLNIQARDIIVTKRFVIGR